MPATTRSGSSATASAPSAPPKKRGKTNAKTAVKGKGKVKPMKTLPEYWPPFRFLDLPREIRDMIYELALQAHPLTNGRCCEYCQDCCIIKVPRAKHSLEDYEPSLIRICRQVRKEGRGVFYSRNSFHMYIQNFNLIPLFGWLNLIGLDLAMALRTLYLDFRGATGWANVRRYLEVKETQLSPDFSVAITGRSSMTFAFNAACEIGADLRKAGISWDQIEQTLRKSQVLAGISGIDEDWPYDSDDSDDFDDHYMNMHGM